MKSHMTQYWPSLAQARDTACEVGGSIQSELEWLTVLEKITTAK